MEKLRRRITAFMIITGLLLCNWRQTVYAFTDLPAGVYTIDASLSCYVNAMGGVEFGDPLLTNTYLIVYEDSSCSVTMEFTKSSVTIYGVTCDTFVDPDPSYKTMDRGVLSGTIGVYCDDGTLNAQDCLYTLSDDTAPNPDDVEVHYVNAINFPIESKKDSYSLAMYINSNVMGVEFCNENELATATTYPATLRVNWASVGEEGGFPAQEENTVSALQEEPVPEAGRASLQNATVNGNVLELPGLHLHGFSLENASVKAVTEEEDSEETAPEQATSTAEEDLVAAVMEKEIADEPVPTTVTYERRQINPILVFCLLLIAACLCVNGFIILHYHGRKPKGDTE